jgi:hypothetical protein
MAFYLPLACATLVACGEVNRSESLPEELTLFAGVFSRRPAR